jgi:site-specific recombinase XerD
MAAKYVAKRDYGKRNSLLDSYEIEFAGRRGAIYRRADSSSTNFQFRLYVREQKTYIRRSLGTAIHKEAVALAQREIAKIDGTVSSGQRVGSVSVLDATTEYLKYLESAVAQGARSQQTLKIETHRVRQVSRFLSEKLPQQLRTKINTIDGKTIFSDYHKWRCQQAEEELKFFTTNQELQGFRKALKYAAKKGLCGPDNYPPLDFQWQKFSRRSIQSIDDYKVVMTGMRMFGKSLKGDMSIYYYNLLRHVFLTMSYCGGRSGEVLNLRNKDCVIHRERKEVHLKFQRTKTNQKQGRETVVFSTLYGRLDGKNENYLIRWLDDYQIHRDPNDYVFSVYTKGSASARYEYYVWYKKMREFFEKQGGEYKRCAYWDTYHCRHRFVTHLLDAGESPEVIAAVVGNSGATIREVYTHMLAKQNAIAVDRRMVERYYLERQQRHHQFFEAESATDLGSEKVRTTLLTNLRAQTRKSKKGKMKAPALIEGLNADSVSSKPPDAEASKDEVSPQ